MRTVLLFAVTAAVATAADEAPRPLLHPLFADHMVLQRDAKDPVWGWTDPGAKVAVEIAGARVEATADAQGRWQAVVGPLPIGGDPLVLKVTGPHDSATISDVLVGDVWLCSGQSNMEMGVGGVKDAQQEIAKADFPRLRLFTVQKKIALEPQAITAGGHWDPCTPTTVATGGWGGFSAVGYFFGRHLHQALDVPIGLIHSSWGGTPIEAWVSPEVLGAMPSHHQAVESILALRGAGDDAAKRMAEWWQANDPGTVAGWQQAAADDAQWKEMELPGAWETKGLPDWDGVVWFRKRVTIPAEWAGKALQLDLGPIDDRDTTWFDGEQIGAKDDWNVARSYKIPAKLATAGEHVIAVRVLDTGGAGGLYGQPDQLKLGVAGDKAATMPLAGPWRYRETTAMTKMPQPPAQAVNQNTATVLYDGMIAPLLPFAIKGAIWYQGESNAWNAADYRLTLPAMIGDWRARFQCGDFPFFVVQLASFMDRKEEPGESKWAELRESQAFAARTVPKCGLAVAIDIGEAKDIHPKNKQEVGRRLGLAAEAIAYGRKLEYSGPVFRAMEVKDGKTIVSFDHADGGLDASGGKLVGFAIAGADGKFVWADAAIDGDHVIVSSAQVPEPKHVRYAWADNPECTLVNKAGLPAVPFRTDAPSP